MAATATTVTGITVRATTATARATTATAPVTISTGTARSTSIPAVARFRRLRGPGAIGLAMTLWDVWKRIPPKQRQRIIKHARKHGPKLAARLVKAQQARRRPRP
jgi:hypothetical protein